MEKKQKLIIEATDTFYELDPKCDSHSILTDNYSSDGSLKVSEFLLNAFCCEKDCSLEYEDFPEFLISTLQKNLKIDEKKAEEFLRHLVTNKELVVKMRDGGKRKGKVQVCFDNEDYNFLEDKYNLEFWLTSTNPLLDYLGSLMIIDNYRTKKDQFKIGTQRIGLIDPKNTFFLVFSPFKFNFGLNDLDLFDKQMQVIQIYRVDFRPHSLHASVKTRLDSGVMHTIKELFELRYKLDMLKLLISKPELKEDLFCTGVKLQREKRYSKHHGILFDQYPYTFNQFAFTDGENLKELDSIIFKHAYPEELERTSQFLKINYPDKRKMWIDFEAEILIRDRVELTKKITELSERYTKETGEDTVSVAPTEFFLKGQGKEVRLTLIVEGPEEYF